jgi:DNA-binding winged helix-turn-helix (wHTH) protein
MPHESAMLILRGPEGVQEWAIDEEIAIGRDQGCEIQLPDRQVSRRHAIVRKVPDGYAIFDAGSKNGLWVNGSPVEGMSLLADGDEISVAARFKLRFVDVEATAPIHFEHRGLRIDPETVSVWVNGRRVEPPLSQPQFELLSLLSRAGGGIVTRDDIVSAVWQDQFGDGVTEDAMDALVRRLRGRLAEIDPQHQYVVTVRGYGFKLELP